MIHLQIIWVWVNVCSLSFEPWLSLGFLPQKIAYFSNLKFSFVKRQFHVWRDNVVPHALDFQMSTVFQWDLLTLSVSDVHTLECPNIFNVTNNLNWIRKKDGTTSTRFSVGSYIERFSVAFCSQLHSNVLVHFTDCTTDDKKVGENDRVMKQNTVLL